MSRYSGVAGANVIVALGVAICLIGLLLNEGEEKPDAPRAAIPGVPVYVPALTSPTDNPLSAGKVALGRYLFYETALSINATIACASCHQQEKAFTDGLAFSTGATGELTRRSSMSLANVAYNGAFTWADNTVVSLEQQALLPLTLEHPVEMGMSGHEAKVLARLRADPIYPPLFADAFPAAADVINLENVVRALASFERTLLSYDAPYDRYRAGDTSALSRVAQRGRELFFSRQLNCFRCHGGYNFRFSIGSRKGETDRAVAYHNNGLYNLDGKGGYPASDRGLIDVTGEPTDMGRFKSPTLRNIALTAPYMHDGSIVTLQQVLAHYARGGRLIKGGADAGDGSRNPFKSEFVRGFSLSGEDTAAVIAFLESLTDERFISNQALSAPTH